MDTIYIRDVLSLKYDTEADIEDFTYHLIGKAFGLSFNQILEMPSNEFAPYQRDFMAAMSQSSEMEDAGDQGYWVNLHYPFAGNTRLLVRRPLVKELRASNRHRNGRVYAGKLLLSQIVRGEDNFQVPFSDLDGMAWLDFNNILELVNFYNEGN